MSDKPKRDYLQAAKEYHQRAGYDPAIDARNAALISIAEFLQELVVQNKRIADAMEWRIEDDLVRRGGRIVEMPKSGSVQ